MHEALASALVSNLLKNAFVHNTENGKIMIDITESQLSISNTSDDNPLNDKQIFERFYQGHKKKGSSGLGLSIVDAICKMYQIAIQYDFRKGFHTFILTFPKKNRFSR